MVAAVQKLEDFQVLSGDKDVVRRVGTDRSINLRQECRSTGRLEQTDGGAPARPRKAVSFWPAGNHVTEDFLWENSGLPAVKGPQGAAEFLLSFGQAMPMAGIRVEMRAIAAAGSTVVTERIDYMIDANGTTLLEIAMAGTLEVAPDGRISAWRDYFDPRPFLG